MPLAMMEIFSAGSPKAMSSSLKRELSQMMASDRFRHQRRTPENGRQRVNRMSDPHRVTTTDAWQNGLTARATRAAGVQ